jgi:Bacterial Ig domain
MNQMQLQFPAAAGQIAARVRRSLELGERLSAARGRPLAPAWCLVGLSALCVVAMVAAGALSARGCRVAPIPLTLGAGTELSVTIPADTPCTILIPAGSATLDDITVDAPPQHGTLTARGRTGTVYRPNRGFKGEDEFAFSLNARSGAGRESSIIRVQASIK